MESISKTAPLRDSPFHCERRKNSSFACWRMRRNFVEPFGMAGRQQHHGRAVAAEHSVECLRQKSLLGLGIAFDRASADQDRAAYRPHPKRTASDPTMGAAAGGGTSYLRFPPTMNTAGIGADLDQAAGVFAGLREKADRHCEGRVPGFLSSGDNLGASGRRCGR